MQEVPFFRQNAVMFSVGMADKGGEQENLFVAVWWGDVFWKSVMLKSNQLHQDQDPIVAHNSFKQRSLASHFKKRLVRMLFFAFLTLEYYMSLLQTV